MKVAIYARVSSERQAENELSISSQLKALHKYVQDRNWDVFREFIDEAESARSDKRPSFQEMISYAKKRQFQVILVWKHSRFARNREDAIVYKALLRKSGIRVISINEHVDDSPAGKLLEGIIEVIDEFYSLNLSADTIRGLKENATRGFVNGSVPYGYKIHKVNDGNVVRSKIIPDDNQSKIVQKIFDLYLNNYGLKSIVNQLNSLGIKTKKGSLWSTTSISYILKNEVYLGTYIYNKRNRHKLQKAESEVIRVEDNHTAIIDKNIFLQVQEKIKFKSTIHPRRASSQYMLSGLLICNNCGLKMVGVSAKNSKYFYYVCNNYIKKGKLACNSRFINKQQIEERVVDSLYNHIATEDNLIKICNILGEEINKEKEEYSNILGTLNSEIVNNKNRLDKLYNILETGKLDIDDLSPRIKYLRKEITNLTERKNLLSYKITESIEIDPNHIRGYLKDISKLIQQSKIEDQKELLNNFINKVYVKKDKATIHYKVPIKTESTNYNFSKVLNTDIIGSS